MVKMPHSKKRNQSVSSIKAVSTKMEHKAVKKIFSLDYFIHSFSECLSSTCLSRFGEEYKIIKPCHGALYTNNAHTQYTSGLNCIRNR